MLNEACAKEKERKRIKPEQLLKMQLLFLSVEPTDYN